MKDKNETPISRNDFNLISIIGRGGFGKVLKVEHKKTKKVYAMKVMSKLKIIDNHAADNANHEKNILLKINNKYALLI